MSRRLLLSLPVPLVGIPLLLALLLASSRLPENKTDEVRTPVVDKKGKLPDEEAMDRLAKEDPLAFIEWSLERYRREVKGYTVTMQKQERIGGKLEKKELIEVCFKEEPHSVFMKWLEGARKADRVLYVEGENAGKMLAHPAGLAGRFVKVVEREVDGDEARASGRYTLNKFGIKKGTERTLTKWQEAQNNHALHVEYLGKINVKEAGDRLCWALKRTNDQPENDGVLELTMYMDVETWLQVGSVLKGEKTPDGTRPLIGEYYWRDLRLNPEFKPNQFQRSAVAP